MEMLKGFGPSLQQPIADFGKHVSRLASELLGKTTSTVNLSIKPSSPTPGLIYVVLVTGDQDEFLQATVINNLPLKREVSLPSFPSPGIFITNGSVAIKVAATNHCQRQHYGLSYIERDPKTNDDKICPCGLAPYRTFLHLQGKVLLRERQRRLQQRSPRSKLRELALVTVAPPYSPSTPSSSSTHTHVINCQGLTGNDHRRSNKRSSSGNRIIPCYPSGFGFYYNKYVYPLKYQFLGSVLLQKGLSFFCRSSDTQERRREDLRRREAVTGPVDDNLKAAAAKTQNFCSDYDNDDCDDERRKHEAAARDLNWTAWQRYEFHLVAERARDLGMQVLLYPEFFVKYIAGTGYDVVDYGNNNDRRKAAARRANSATSEEVGVGGGGLWAATFTAVSTMMGRCGGTEKVMDVQTGSIRKGEEGISKVAGSWSEFVKMGEWENIGRVDEVEEVGLEGVWFDEGNVEEEEEESWDGFEDILEEEFPKLLEKMMNK